MFSKKLKCADSLFRWPSGCEQCGGGDTFPVYKTFKKLFKHMHIKPLSISFKLRAPLPLPK